MNAPPSPIIYSTLHTVHITVSYCSSLSGENIYVVGGHEPGGPGVQVAGAAHPPPSFDTVDRYNTRSMTWTIGICTLGVDGDYREVDVCVLRASPINKDLVVGTTPPCTPSPVEHGPRVTSVPIHTITR